MAEVIRWAHSEQDALRLAGESTRPLLLDFSKER